VTPASGTFGRARALLIRARRVAGRGKRRLLSVPRRVAALPAFVGDARRRAVWRYETVRQALAGVRLERVTGAAPSDALPVIVCLWNRPERIRTTLQLLAQQKDTPPLRVIFWNNKPSNDPRYLGEIQRFGAVGAIAGVEYHSSRVNIGGIARFLVARSITRHSASAPFVMLDDDLDPSPSFVRELLAAYTPRTYAGFWAFVILDHYWERRNAVPGEAAQYVGTGGTVCDSSLVRDLGFFTRLPARYAFIEDLWASAYASSRGWRVEKVDTHVELTSEDSNQYLGMIDLKARFWSYLRQQLETVRPL
jgi:hypothetical protein